MAQYIDKSALVAEINRRIKEHHSGYLVCLKDILSLLDSLEVKEVDLEKELDYDDYMTFFKEHPEYSNRDWGFDETWTFAQYCYKLGLKAQEGE